MKSANRQTSQDSPEHLLGIMSHELRTPLASIKAYAHILGRVLQKNHDTIGLSYLDKIDDKADVLIRLINDLVDVARIKQGRFELNREVFELDEFLKNTIADLRLVIPTHALVLKGKTNTSIVADRTRLAQVISNLIKNASEYSEPDKKIIITATYEKSHITIAVQDFGIGVAKHDKPKMFDLFYRGRLSRHANSSLGIGLFISNEIIKHHRGKLTVTSHVGQGTTLIIKLPVVSKQ